MTAALVRPGDPHYPKLLAALASPPELYVRGTLTEADALGVAIVGSRRATPYGVEVAGQLASDLAARGVTIVSGLARGIDTAAHRGALAAGGRTIAVLGCGIDVVYPPENRRLACEIEQAGGVVSQFAPGTPPLPHHFPARNRTLAGLALGVVVVEAAERSGALITAGLAADLGREVFAVPGKITSGSSRGAHKLIQDGAKLVQDWTDVVHELPEPSRRAVVLSTSPGPANRPSDGTPEGRVLGLLAPDEPRHIEELIVAAGTDAAHVSSVLVALEIGGWVQQLPGQRWLSVATRARRAPGEVRE
jgi:DNA processing protein